MSTKLSFFEVPGLDTVKLERLAEGMLAERFGGDASFGFLIDRRSTEKIEGRYVQRMQTSEILHDPFGAEYKQESLYFSEQRFAILTSTPNLIVYNSTSLLRPLIGRLSEFSEFSMAFKDLRWHPEDVYSALVAFAPAARIMSARVEDFSLTTGVQAKMLFVSVDKDVRQSVRTFLKNDRIAFSSLKVEYEYAGEKRICEIRNNGTIQNYGEYDSVVTDIWVKTIQNIARVP